MIDINWTVVLSTMIGTLLALALGICLIGLLAKKSLPILTSKLDAFIDGRVKREREHLGHEIQQRVTRGVTEGIADGVAALPSSQMLKRTRQTMAKTGREIVGSGFQTLFGKRVQEEQILEHTDADEMHIMEKSTTES